MVDSKVTVKKKSVNLPSAKIADGVLATASLLKNDALPIVSENQFKRAEVLTSESEIVFQINNASVRSNELSKQSMKDMKSFAKNTEKDTTITLKGVEIVGYASPDGPEDNNENLAKNRQAAATNADYFNFSNPGIIGGESVCGLRLWSITVIAVKGR